MMDQAEILRQKLLVPQSQKYAKTIGIVSGKGGVGKSNVAVNFSLGLAKEGKKVLLIDMDVGMGNVEILLGKSTSLSFVDIFKDNVSIQDVIQTGYDNLSYISGGTGLQQIFELNVTAVNKLLNELDSIMGLYDYIIFDMGAGITESSRQFLRSVHEIFIVTTPEPTAIMDAYSMMKHLCEADKTMPYYLIVNKTMNRKDGEMVENRICNAAKHFLNQDVQSLGYLSEDKAVMRSVLKQVPFLLHEPTSKVSNQLKQAVKKYLHKGDVLQTGSFVTKLRSFLFERKG